jgi:hypothetical protein
MGVGVGVGVGVSVVTDLEGHSWNGMAGNREDG